jgi:hypothetical protein
MGRSKEALMEMYIDLMKQSDESLNYYRKDLKYKLIGAAEGENAIAALKDALISAKSQMKQ